MATADLLLHPVRLRIVQAFLGDRTLTTADLRSELPDVPVATLYRHVGVLAEAGVLEVVGERRGGGGPQGTHPPGPGGGPGGGGGGGGLGRRGDRGGLRDGGGAAAARAQRRGGGGGRG